MGCDIARFGDDSSVFAIREYNKIYPLHVYNKLDNVEVAQRIRELADVHSPKVINIDVIGLGAGVFDILKSNGYPAAGINVGQPSMVMDGKGNKRFVNLRAELWWTLREELDPNKDEPLLLPPDDDLLADLAAPTFDYTPRGQIQIEPKEKTKERLGRSPDRADAVMLTFAPLARRPSKPLNIPQPTQYAHPNPILRAGLRRPKF